MGMKMKKTFQHKRWTLVFFVLLDIFSSVAVSRVSAQEEVLIGAVGESLAFPTRVPVSGTIIYEGRNIGLVFNKQNETDSDEKFKNRLHWNSEFFTLSDLKSNDSGVYVVESTKEEKRRQVYQLNVYEKVSEPKVTTLDYDPPESELCRLQCSVRIVGGANLYWFNGSVILNHTNSSSPDNTLNLLLEIQQLDTYSCVASNPVSKQTTTVNFTELCPRKLGGDQRLHIIGIVCSLIFILVVIAMGWYFRRRKHQHESSQRTEGREICVNLPLRKHVH
ncbi:SLAM family member 7-like isoform X2 [Salminus brasiliensis]|uniref:SLAM family member 7-like isoform X2 n=1 Tax=Salminus brasiliensis TaxID=930266 RepID=UPI003B8395D7